MDLDEKNQKDYIETLTGPDFAGPTRPLHIKANSWDETTKQIEDSIRELSPFEGQWQSYILNYQLFVPEQLRPLVEKGGVITVSTENHLMLFGNKHWNRMQRILAKEVGLSPVHNEVARHFYSKMYKFSKLNDNGTIDIPLNLIYYAGLEKDVALIGMIYHAEIHNKESYMQSEKPEIKKSLLDRFRKIKF